MTFEQFEENMRIAIMAASVARQYHDATSAGAIVSRDEMIKMATEARGVAELWELAHTL